MPIPLGVLAIAGAGAAATPAYEWIATGTGTGSNTSITFSGIDQSYKHLQIRYVAKSTDAAQYGNMRMRLNGNTGSNYSYHDLFGTGSAVSSTAAASQTGIFWNFGIAGNSSSFSLIPGVLDILDYTNTSKNTTMRLFNGALIPSGQTRVGIQSAGFYQTNAITSISFELTSGSYTTATRISLYGIKG